MTDDLMQSLPDVIVVPIPTPLFKRVTRVPHTFPPAWEHKRVPKCETAPEQIERECKSCGLVRITVMRGPGERRYRWGDARYQFEEPIEPDCTREVDIKREASA